MNYEVLRILEGGGAWCKITFSHTLMIHCRSTYNNFLHVASYLDVLNHGQGQDPQPTMHNNQDILTW